MTNQLNIQYQGRLYAEDFLRRGITNFRIWNAFNENAFDKFLQSITQIYNIFPKNNEPSEAITENDFIIKILESLGWEHYILQAHISNEDIPDISLYENSEKKSQAQNGKVNICNFLDLIVESKAWGIPLDRKKENKPNENVPSNQILRYLSRMEIESNQRALWGVLTNGKIWRLYYQKSKSRSEEYLEFNIETLINDNDIDSLKLFYIFFGHMFFYHLENGKPIRELALEQSKLWEETVKQDLANHIFNDIFQNIAQNLINNDPDKPPKTKEYLQDVKENSLIFLYRLLFTFYAEDRELLPINSQKYYTKSIKSIRDEIKDNIQKGITHFRTSRVYWEKIKNIFNAINFGEENYEIPPYNGGLFNIENTLILNRSFINDDTIQDVIYKLSYKRDGMFEYYINYRDLSVQQLGSVYEKLLEYDIADNFDNLIILQLSNLGRKKSGSYYTDDGLVKLIIHNTLSPLINQRVALFSDKINEYIHGKITASELQQYDSVDNIISMRIADIAMGSGHFLVALVDYLADISLELMNNLPSGYVSPVDKKINDIRQSIIKNSKWPDGKTKWHIKNDHLNDKQIIRRIILKQVIHGVDLNPMAVELAKVALWLHSFTVGAPLSFLDHHLKCGNSLFGEQTKRAFNEIAELTPLFTSEIIENAKSATKEMEYIHNLADININEAHQSQEAYIKLINKVKPLEALLNFCYCLRYLGLYNINSKRAHPSIIKLFEDKDFIKKIANQKIKKYDGIPASIIFNNIDKNDYEKNLNRIFYEVNELQKQLKFFSFECAFPHIWQDWTGNKTGGFDAIIGNPPWERMKLQQVEWMGERLPEFANKNKVERDKAISNMKNDNPLKMSYLNAEILANNLLNLSRKSGDFSELSSGDINYYALFVERSLNLIKPDGMVGLVVPSGIASDKTYSKFIEKILTHQRLYIFYDFENKNRNSQYKFFSDVDDRFKFCTICIGGNKLKFDKVKYANFVEDIKQINDSKLEIGAHILTLFNPKTHTLPIIRNKIDWEILQQIYEHIPIFDTEIENNNWNIRYTSLFHMTGDSHLFYDKKMLDTMKSYIINPHLFKRGDEEYIALYEAKMINQFNHRYAGVEVNKNNLFNRAIGKPVNQNLLKNPKFIPTPQYWVNKQELESKLPQNIHWVIGFRNITRTTDARTIISAILPRLAYGNSLQLILPQKVNDKISNEENSRLLKSFKTNSWLLVANLNSFILDYIARSKIQGTNASWYIIEQLPIIPIDNYKKCNIKDKTAFDLVKEWVLYLNYSSNDLKPFAVDLGYDGEPFIWDEISRLHIICKLNALFFKLYGINDEETIKYILGTFPIVKKESIEKYGMYIEETLIIQYHRAISNGDYESIIDIV